MRTFSAKQFRLFLQHRLAALTASGQYLVDLTKCSDSGQALVWAVTAFVNLLLSGVCPAAVAPFFFGGRLIALQKKTWTTEYDRCWPKIAPSGVKVRQS